MTPRLPCTCTAEVSPCPACTAWARRHPHKPVADRTPDPDAPPARSGRRIQSLTDLRHRLAEAEAQLARTPRDGVHSVTRRYRLRKRIEKYRAKLNATEGNHHA